MNFRGIRKLSLKLNDTTVLIGENNTGKTTILDALQICLSRNLNRKGGIFSEYDYHLPEKDSQPVESEAIEVTLWFIEQFVDQWPEEIFQRLDNVVQVGDDERLRVVLRVRSYYDDTLEDFVTNWDFLDLDSNEMVNAKAPRNIISLQQLAPVFYLSALRDSAQEFRPHSPFWRPFVRSLKIDPTVRKELEDELADLNQRVLDSNDSFSAIKERLSNTGNMVALATDEPVGIEAIPSRIFDILSRTQVMLTSVTGARLPIGRHGEGTQSLAVICLFDAFLQSKLEDSYTKHTAPILALEEPEAHLHPSATGAVAKLLQDLKGQKVIATHSSELVAHVPLTSLRRLRRKDGGITVHHLKDGILTDHEIRKISYHIGSTRGNLLFARCWLLVEGETDRLIFEGCSRVLGRDLVYDGVSYVEYRQLGIGVDALIKFADCMGIEWLLVADNDSADARYNAGTKYIESAQKQIGNRPKSRHIHQLMHGDMEVFLCMEGYGHLYEVTVSQENKATITAERNTLDYWRQVTKKQTKGSKPRNAVAVIEKMEKRGLEGVPSQIREIINHALTLAGEARDG